MLKQGLFASVVLVLTLLMQGCMPTTQPYVPVKVEADKAIVYVYRPESFIARGSTWSLKVNDKVVSKYFINNGYIPLYVNEGNADLILYHENLGFVNTKYDVMTITNIKAGEIYYVKAFMKFGGEPHFELMDSKVGEQEISSTLYYIDQMK